MQPESQDGHRTTVTVVSRVVDELIVEGDSPRLDGEAVVGLQNLLQTGVRPPSIADQDAETARVQKRLVAPRDAVDDPGDADGVVGTLPPLAGELGAGRHRSINVGELVGLDVGAGESGSEK